MAVHFGAAVVRLEQNNLSKRTVYVGVVCASGIGISRYIKTKLEKVFGNIISIETYGKGDLDSNTIRKTDFFVSNINMEVPDGADIIFINPLITDSDIKNIDANIRRYEINTIRKTDFFVSNINMEVPDGADIIFINPLITDSDIKNIDANIRRYEITPDKSEDRLDFYNQLDLIHNLTAHMKMILENFNIISISRDIDFEKYLDVLRDKLIDSGDNSEIILSDIVAREKIATQVFPEMGFALFHTKTYGTKHIRMSVCISEYEITPDKSEDRLDFYNQLDLIHNLTAQMKMILENFNIISISRDINFEKYLDVLRDKLIDSGDNSEIILSDIDAREKIATQVFPEMGFALFHTKTSGTKHIRMSVCISDSETFENEYFKGISCIITMLLPDDEHLNMNRKLLGFISEMLIEDPTFLEVLNSGDVSVGKDYLSKILKKYLKSIIN